MAIEDIKDRVDSMAVADEVSAAVRKEIETHRMYGFTLWQRIAATAMAAAVVAGAVVQIGQALGWFS